MTGYTNFTGSELDWSAITVDDIRALVGRVRPPPVPLCVVTPSLEALTTAAGVIPDIRTGEPGEWAGLPVVVSKYATGPQLAPAAWFHQLIGPVRLAGPGA